MPQIIPLNHKFCCIALSGVPELNISLPCDILPNLSIYSANPFELDNHWTEWLGSLEIEHLKKCNFIIVSYEFSEKPKVLDYEHESLKQQTYLMLYSILLQTIFPYEKGSVLIGSRVNDKIEIRQFAKLDRIFRHDKAFPSRLGNEKIENSKLILTGLQAIYKNENLFERIKGGFDAWIKAIKERRGDYRLHQFVRSVEAIIKPVIGKTKGHFIHRCKLLTSVDEVHSTILGEMYDLRSYVEHMNDWKLLYKNISESEPEEIAEFRTYQAEKLSEYVYNRLLSDINFLSNFKNDEMIDDFWKQRDNEIKIQWGQTLKLDRISFDY